MKKVDLHIHTTVSDGTYSPSEVVDLALSAGLSAIAITDHDTASGCARAQERGKELGIEVVPGIEISTKFKTAVHILGYYIDPQSDKLREMLDWIVNDRNERNRKIVKMMQSDGFAIDYDEMCHRFGEVIGRPHFARILVEQNAAESIQDAFDHLLIKGGRYWVPRTILPIERAVEIISEAGGVPVLAHPYQYKMDDDTLCELIELCIAHGLKGMETRYSGYSQDQTDHLEMLADDYDLFYTGGSDFHGDNKRDISIGTGKGSLEVPYMYFQGLKLAAGKGF